MPEANKRDRRQFAAGARRSAPGIRTVSLFARYADGSGATRRELGTAALSLDAMHELLERLRSYPGAPGTRKAR